jgi:hypothetical protein
MTATCVKLRISSMIQVTAAVGRGSTYILSESIIKDWVELKEDMNSVEGFQVRYSETTVITYQDRG